MAIDLEKRKFLEAKARELRHVTVDTTFNAGSGHLGGSLSMMDAACLLYYHVMKIDKTNPDFEDRDRFVMSKGHAGIGWVAILADLGFIEKEDLKTFNLTGSKLGMHLDANKVPGVEVSTGSLGHGLAMALGMALSAKLLKKDFYTYCLLGDGECDEGSIWESAMAIGHYNTNNLITMVDRNHAMIDGLTEDVMRLEPFEDKWKAFGFHAVTVDGHDMKAMDDAINEAKERTDKPTCIILDTVKGQGVSFAAGDYKWHYGALNEERRDLAHKSVDEYHDKRDKEVLN